MGSCLFPTYATKKYESYPAAFVLKNSNNKINYFFLTLCLTMSTRYNSSIDFVTLEIKKYDNNPIMSPNTNCKTPSGKYRIATHTISPMEAEYNKVGIKSLICFRKPTSINLPV